MHDESPEEKSKSAVKRELHALKDLGSQLVQLSPKAFAKIPASEELREAIIEARKLERGALQRHLRHIRSLLVNEDNAAIQAALDIELNSYQNQTRQFHALENWRDRLLTEDMHALEEFLQEFPHADRQHLKQLIRNAHKEQTQQKPPKAARSLFQYLRSLREQT